MFVATSSYMEPSKKGLHMEEKEPEEGRKCVALVSSFFNGYFLSVFSRGQPDLCGCVFMKVLDCIFSFCREA